MADAAGEQFSLDRMGAIFDSQWSCFSDLASHFTVVVKKKIIHHFTAGFGPCCDYRFLTIYQLGFKPSALPGGLANWFTTVAGKISG